MTHLESARQGCRGLKGWLTKQRHREGDIPLYIGIMENKMETTIVYWGYIRIMEQKMETTIDLKSLKV